MSSKLQAKSDLTSVENISTLFVKSQKIIQQQLRVLFKYFCLTHVCSDHTHLNRLGQQSWLAH